MKNQLSSVEDYSYLLGFQAYDEPSTEYGGRSATGAGNNRRRRNRGYSN